MRTRALPPKPFAHPQGLSIALMALTDSRCVNQVATGAVLGGAVGGSIGALWGTYEAFTYRVPGLAQKVRYIGRTTVGSSAVFGLFLAAGSLIRCGRS
mmetsp:Transcript_12032/g.38101  ORF Transcript_12032/g.38101 Transcript_12032/m.38101 type:complete len:98 (+) Transcript_12032:143-436(+)